MKRVCAMFVALSFVSLSFGVEVRFLQPVPLSAGHGVNLPESISGFVYDGTNHVVYAISEEFPGFFRFAANTESQNLKLDLATSTKFGLGSVRVPQAFRPRGITYFQSDRTLVVASETRQQFRGNATYDSLFRVGLSGQYLSSFGRLNGPNYIFDVKFPDAEHGFQALSLAPSEGALYSATALPLAADGNFVRIVKFKKNEFGVYDEVAHFSYEIDPNSRLQEILAGDLETLLILENAAVTSQSGETTFVNHLFEVNLANARNQIAENTASNFNGLSAEKRLVTDLTSDLAVAGLPSGQWSALSFGPKLGGKATLLVGGASRDSGAMACAYELINR